MVERAILESNLCCTEGPSPPVEKDGVYLLSLCLMDLRKSCRNVYLAICLVLLIIVGIVEV